MGPLRLLHFCVHPFAFCCRVFHPFLTRNRYGPLPLGPVGIYITAAHVLVPEVR